MISTAVGKIGRKSAGALQFPKGIDAASCMQLLDEGGVSFDHWTEDRLELRPDIALGLF